MELKQWNVIEPIPAMTQFKAEDEIILDAGMELEIRHKTPTTEMLKVTVPTGVVWRVNVLVTITEVSVTETIVTEKWKNKDES